MKYKYFTDDEFECRCGCGRNKISKSLINLLDVARDVAGIPFVITSGYRCPTYNIAVGGKPTSSHIKGLAADIECDNSRHRGLILASLYYAGFDRIGIDKNFIHADIDPDKDEEVAWLY